MITHASRPRVIYIVAMEKIINCGVEHAHRQISVTCHVKRKIRQRIMKKQHRSVFHSMRVRRSWNATWYFQSNHPHGRIRAFKCLRQSSAMGGFWKCQNRTKTTILKNFDIRRDKRERKGATREPKGAKRKPKMKKIIKNHTLERSKFSFYFHYYLKKKNVKTIMAHL